MKVFAEIKTKSQDIEVVHLESKQVGGELITDCCRQFPEGKAACHKSKGRLEGLNVSHGSLFLSPQGDESLMIPAPSRNRLTLN